MVVETSELIQKVRRIEIKTRGLSKQIFAGQYHSAFKGRGVAFSEVREYQFGDDIRNVDWNVTARFNHPYVKVFEEERELTVVLMIDASGSGTFGSNTQIKRDLITEISALLAFSAIHNNDKIGIVFFSDKMEKFIPPKKGRKHILTTGLAEPLKFVTNAIKKRAAVFIISDFQCADFEDALTIAARKHDIAGLRITDPRDMEMPDIGLVRFADPETGEHKWIDTSAASVRNAYNQFNQNHLKWLKSVFSKCGVDYVNMITGEDYVKPLLTMFKARA